MKTPSTGLEKIPTGVSGLDEVLSGGIPKGRTTLVNDEAGVEKTVLTLQMLIKASRRRGTGAIFAGFEEDVSAVGADLPPVAAVIDKWIHLSNIVEKQERSRTLSIVKSRGTFAASTMREIIRTSEGIVLRKVYVRGQRVLTGQRRTEEEARHRAQIALWQREIEVMSAQLLADKLALESINGEHPQATTGETRPSIDKEPVVRAHSSRRDVSPPRARSRRKGVPV